MMRKSFVAAAVLGALSLPTINVAHAEEAASPHTFTGNLTLTSDYRFRGVSQTKRLGAVQGGIDYTHSSGLYLGTWASSISADYYLGSSGMETDGYGGYRTEVMPGLGLDVGYLYYYYAGAKMSNGTKYDNQEAYASLSYAGLTGKISYALSDYFGAADTKGTTYAELNYGLEVAPKTTLSAHVGRTNVKTQTDYTYTDYKLGASYDLNGWALGAAYVGNSGMTDAFKAANTLDGKELYKSAVVFSVGKTF